MTCGCCKGEGFHSTHHHTIDCGPCHGTGEIARHGIIQVGIDLPVDWDGDMPSNYTLWRFYGLEKH